MICVTRSSEEAVRADPEWSSNMTNTKKYILAGSAVLAAAASLFTGFAGNYLASLSAGGKRQTLEEALEWQRGHYDISFADDLETFTYTVDGYEGYTLHAQFFKNPQPSGKYIILTHGYTDNRYGNLKYMKMYLDRGYNCVIYDLRGHGENEPAPCTYGILEAKDLLAMIKDTRERFGEDIVLGLHGESLGAATTATVMQYHPRVDFAVADCGFADIENVLKGAVAYNHLPTWFTDVASVFFKLKYGYSYNQMRPVDSLAGNHVPFLFIHGAEDTFILPSNSARMSEATSGYSELHLISGAKHASSVLTDPALYAQYVNGFLDHLGL